MNHEIAVVIPAYFNLKDFQLTFEKVLSQSHIPKEIIIIDSSKDDVIKQFIDKLSHNTDIKIIYLPQTKKLFPGAARNLGASIASSKWIAFLDTKTMPNSNWLELSLSKVISDKAEIVFGKTKYKAVTSFQFYLIGSTYGFNPIVTVPGTLISNKKFHETNRFNSIIRSGEDIQWRAEVSKKFITTEIDDKDSLSYSSLPRHLFKTLKKFFIYQIHGASADIQINSRSLFLGIFLLLVAFIVPRWNSFLPGWDNHPLYIPNITKIYILSIAFSTMAVLIFNRSIIDQAINSPVVRALKLTVLILAITIVLRWNYSVAGFVESSSLYVPHITKIFISFLFAATLFYRGIFFPLSHGLTKKDIFPTNWFFIGILGILLDAVKAPGYILGAIWKIFRV